MSQLNMTDELTEKDEEVKEKIIEALNKKDVDGYVLILRCNTDHDDAALIQEIKMFNVGNDFDELTDMLIAATQYLPSEEMKG